ncbi:hypothetical protein [Rosistilla oblonga]|uniref:hypothetical protein n=1 Tax=Rosistilla oblonga TaxID=2527990 RepID=UPI003A96CD1E
MLKPNSVFRELPRALDRKQVLFLDGIGKSYEIAAFAYQRLKEMLTTIANGDLESASYRELYVLALLDAWAIVDSIDRFSALYKLLPHSVMRDDTPVAKAEHETLRKVRDVRNVTDHLAQRMDYIMSKSGAAMGMLTWCTSSPLSKNEVLACTLVPGPLGKQSAPMANPVGRTVEMPTGLIAITAGEHTADLSEAIRIMADRVEDIETQLENQFSQHETADGEKLSRSRSNLLIVSTISFNRDLPNMKPGETSDAS